MTRYLFSFSTNAMWLRDTVSPILEYGGSYTRQARVHFNNICWNSSERCCLFLDVAPTRPSVHSTIYFGNPDSALNSMSDAKREYWQLAHPLTLPDEPLSLERIRSTTLFEFASLVHGYVLCSIPGRTVPSFLKQLFGQQAVPANAVGVAGDMHLTMVERNQRPTCNPSAKEFTYRINGWWRIFRYRTAEETEDASNANTAPAFVYVRWNAGWKEVRNPKTAGPAVLRSIGRVCERHPHDQIGATYEITAPMDNGIMTISGPKYFRCAIPGGRVRYFRYGDSTDDVPNGTYIPATIMMDSVDGDVWVPNVADKTLSGEGLEELRQMALLHPARPAPPTHYAYSERSLLYANVPIPQSAHHLLLSASSSHFINPFADKRPRASKSKYANPHPFFAEPNPLPHGTSAWAKQMLSNTTNTWEPEES